MSPFRRFIKLRPFVRILPATSETTSPYVKRQNSGSVVPRNWNEVIIIAGKNPRQPVTTAQVGTNADEFCLLLPICVSLQVELTPFVLERVSQVNFVFGRFKRRFISGEPITKSSPVRF